MSRVEVKPPQEDDNATLWFDICAGCGYTLDGLPLVGICPECGRSYDRHQLVVPAWASIATGGLRDGWLDVRSVAIDVAFVLWILLPHVQHWDAASFLWVACVIGAGIIVPLWQRSVRLHPAPFLLLLNEKGMARSYFDRTPSPWGKWAVGSLLVGGIIVFSYQFTHTTQPAQFWPMATAFAVVLAVAFFVGRDRRKHMELDWAIVVPGEPRLPVDRAILWRNSEVDVRWVRGKLIRIKADTRRGFIARRMTTYVIGSPELAARLSSKIKHFCAEAGGKR